MIPIKHGGQLCSLCDMMTMSYSERFTRYMMTGCSVAPLLYKTQLAQHAVTVYSSQHCF